jgi:hypothetical protein
VTEFPSGSIGATDAFTVEETTGKIYLGKKLDYERVQHYELIIVAGDDDGLSVRHCTQNFISTHEIFQSSGTVTLSVVDVNDNKPTCQRSAFTVTVPENDGRPIDVQLHLSTGQSQYVVYFLLRQSAEDNRHAVLLRC